MLKSVLLFSVSCGFSWFLLHYFESASPQVGLFTADDLKNYNGVRRKELYLSILGNVHDVTKGANHYGPGKTYHGFVGQDNSRSFVTGEFGSKTSDDVIGFDNKELCSLNHWVRFYKKEYKKIGKLIGRYYNENGKLTPYGKEIKLLMKRAEQAQVDSDLDKLKFPPCNIEWDPEKGSRVWCTKRSGGIDRDWVGYPRKYYEVGAESYRCACVKAQDTSQSTLMLYDHCDMNSESCFVTNEV